MKQARIEQLLPQVMQRGVRDGSPLRAIVDLMEAFHAPAEAILNELGAIFDPRRTPDRFVPYLAGWVDLGMLLERPDAPGSAAAPTLSTGLGYLRELTANAAVLSERRGTSKGLRLFLETATGAKGFVINEQVTGADGKVRPFHIQVQAPTDLMQHRVLIDKIIDLEKPAYVTYDLVFAQRADEGKA